MQLVRSLIFQVWMYGLMTVMGVACAPMALWSRRGAYVAIDAYISLVLWGLRRICGLSWEVRGAPPRGDALIAAKHQSFLDILILLKALPQARFIMKRSLVWAPIVGFYALRIGASPVTRGKGAESLKQMLDGVALRGGLEGQLVIFPQGTRVRPGARVDYKYGAYALYQKYDLPCGRVALNTGLFWPRIGLIRKPGVAVVEFLDPVPPGLNASRFMAALESAIEPASDALAEEARRRHGV